MRESADEITRQNVGIIAITPAAGSLIAKYIDAYGPYPFEVLGDPEQHAFEGLGHNVMPKWKLLGMAALGFVIGRMKDFKPKEANKLEVVNESMKTSDIYQQGGTWLFDRKGNVLWKHIDETPGDHATIEQVRAALS
ncbi:peroxiredoxin-like family protein [Tumebacillus permanentifrigoris]|uniref:Alkyl-hydroperoxide reductase/thiol specific antioxidant family protein n=1 Tax=Tumebacillus permanentifrigoris TaxID=378543 RepID=A0A316DE86_9BACL|nr:alkyl-hydroperoxide reductase/thiol specific antioxidant family protein [Tumebacillus permanentifrigoris]